MNTATTVTELDWRELGASRRNAKTQWVLPIHPSRSRRRASHYLAIAQVTNGTTFWRVALVQYGDRYDTEESFATYPTELEAFAATKHLDAEWWANR